MTADVTPAPQLKMTSESGTKRGKYCANPEEFKGLRKEYYGEFDQTEFDQIVNKLDNLADHIQQHT